jgi:hypothetical protein
VAERGTPAGQGCLQRAEPGHESATEKDPHDERDRQDHHMAATPVTYQGGGKCIHMWIGLVHLICLAQTQLFVTHLVRASSSAVLILV